MPLSHSDVRKLLDLLDRAERLDSLDIKLGDFVLRARKPGAPLPAPQPAERVSSVEAGSPAPVITTAQPVATNAVVPASSIAEVPAGMTAIRSPMLGTFYRTPAPDQPAFVQEGASVAPGDTVCLVEVMKLFNSVKTPIAGRVHRILAEHGKLVQHDQILMLIEAEAKP